MSPAFRFSIAVNVVLLGLVTALLWRARSAAPSSAALSIPPAFSRAAAPQAEGINREFAPSSPAVARLTPAAVAQLEHAGISRDILVSALREDFNRRWDRRLLELEKQQAPKPLSSRQYVEFARWREAEQIRELKETLGEEGYLAWDKDQTLRTLNSTGLPLTTEEAEQAYRLQKEFDEQYQALELAREDGVGDRADVAALQAQAQRDLDGELVKLLGQSRLDAMRGITGPVAEVQWRYGDLNPTAAQTNAVLRAEADYRAGEAALAQRLNTTAVEAANVTAELQALAAAREENLRRIFGPAAYDAMKRQNDSTYQTLQQYAATWGLQDREIQSVYQTLQGFHDEADRARTAAALREAAGQPVDWRELNAALDQNRRQTEAGLQTLLGPERLHRLKQNGLLTTR